MFFAARAMPRKMLPPPTTTPTCDTFLRDGGHFGRQVLHPLGVNPEGLRAGHGLAAQFE